MIMENPGFQPPHFYVIARVVGRDDSFPIWEDRLEALCGVAATEPHAISYYWGQDLDGEPNTLWGLEGYVHAVGAFLGHPKSDIFKQQMALIDRDELLRHEQGLKSRDYDGHVFDFQGGYFTRPDDQDKDIKTSHVAVHYIWSHKGKRQELLSQLCQFAQQAEESKESPLQSCGVLKECMDFEMTCLWLRFKSVAEFEAFKNSSPYKSLMSSVDGLIKKLELHQSRSFNGFIDQKLQWE